LFNTPLVSSDVAKTSSCNKHRPRGRPDPSRTRPRPRSTKTKTSKWDKSSTQHCINVV